MRILCFDEVPASTRGGQEHSMFDECVGLAKRGHEVSIGYVEHGDFLPRYEAAGVRPVQVSRIILPTGERVLGMVEWASSVARSARVPADLVCINQYHDTLFGSAIARLKRVPLVCHLRLMPPSAFCGQWRIGVRGVTRFIAVSAAVREAWAERGFDPGIIDVVHDGIDTERFRPAVDRLAMRRALGVPDDAYMIAFAGRLDRQKRLEALLEAFARLEMPASAARLVIAGRPVDHASPEAGAAYVEGLKRLAGELGVADAVHWLGSRPDVPEILAASDVSALFTLYPEALARTTYESMACGTPPIAQRDGGMAEVLTGEFSRFLFDGSVESAVGLLRALRTWRTDDPSLAERLRAHALKHFSKEAMVAGIEQSFLRALETRPLRGGPSSALLRERDHAFAAAQRARPA